MSSEGSETIGILIHLKHQFTQMYKIFGLCKSVLKKCLFLVMLNKIIYIFYKNEYLLRKAVEMVSGFLITVFLSTLKLIRNIQYTHTNQLSITTMSSKDSSSFQLNSVSPMWRGPCCKGTNGKHSMSFKCDQSQTAVKWGKKGINNKRDFRRSLVEITINLLAAEE